MHLSQYLLPSLPSHPWTRMAPLSSAATGQSASPAPIVASAARAVSSEWHVMSAHAPHMAGPLWMGGDELSPGRIVMVGQLRGLTTK